MLNRRFSPAGVRLSVRVWLALCVLVMGLAWLAPAHAAMDVFGRSDDGNAATDNAASQGGPMVPSPGIAIAPDSHLPVPIRNALETAVRWQGELNERMQDALDDIRDAWSDDPAPDRMARGRAAVVTILLASLLYGVLHAVGPGHGKLLVGTYLSSHRAQLRHAALLSGWSALAQALCAIALVAGLGWLAGASLGKIMNQAAQLETVSYGALCLAGLWTLWSIVTRRDCCDVGTRVDLMPKARLAQVERDGDDTPAAYMGARMNRPKTSARWQSVRTGKVWLVRQIFVAGLAVGIRPCMGAVFVLLTAMANGIFFVGVLSTLAMAVGVAATVFAVGVAGLGVNRWLTARFGARGGDATRWRTGLAAFGAVLIVLFSAAQLTMLALGWIKPTLI